MLVFLFLAGVVQAFAGSSWALLVEPSFMDYTMRRPIPGSKRTIMAIVRVENGEIHPLTREEKKSVHLTYEQIEAEARKNASAVLATLTPKYFRDHHKVITHAILQSENPLTASCVLAPDFAEKFASTLGPDLLIAIPSRFQVLVFSRQDVIYQQFSDYIAERYLDAIYPVSRDIFTLERGRLISLGQLE